MGKKIEQTKSRKDLLALIQEELDKLTPPEEAKIKDFIKNEAISALKIDENHKDYKTIIQASLWIFVGAKLLKEEAIYMHRDLLRKAIKERFSLKEIQNLDFYLGSFFLLDYHNKKWTFT